ncbi:wee1-like protein kinase isoform X2 [Formica exsecta]|uniref:wee1-like protein kinase isoform X2 n=1 Tax=Formica exsecta TaxID=72781 RepID=UPI0011418578|nr:wee1-like protein kinase isoform X2 [Formica exsecta]
MIPRVAMKAMQKLHYEACDMQNEELSWSCRVDNNSDCDIGNSSADDFGTPPPLQPRKLFETMDCIDESQSTNNNRISPSKGTPAIKIPVISHKDDNSEKTCSPPYKCVRALRLFDSPTTPKTMIEKNIVMQTPFPSKCTRLFFLDKPRPSKISPSYQNKSDKPVANVNPFTPTGMLITAKKRSRSKRSLNGSGSSPDMQKPKFDLADSEDSDNEYEHATKRVALQDSNISRYHKEFHELDLIGSGSFGSVYKCINRLDGCTYAVKRSRKPIAGIVSESNALNEVYAHAVLGKHQHVVRYYSAWAEDSHMIIQNEYCNGGSLADAITNLQKEKKQFSKAEMRQLLLHVAEGLKYIHSMQLVHMDIKPANIFISREGKLPSSNYDSTDDGFEEDETVDEITYKIGDLGHVTSINNPHVEEGDCRYLPLEVLQDEYSHLPKADIFALGLTVYEAGGAGPMPKNGLEWHRLREGNVPDLPHYGRDLNSLLKLMTHPDPQMRPSATCLTQHRVLLPLGNKTKAQLRRELSLEKLKNEILTKRLKDAAIFLKNIAPNVTDNIDKQLRSVTMRPRVIGKKINRSNSII